MFYFLNIYLSIVRAPATHPKTPRADLEIEIREFISKSMKEKTDFCLDDCDIKTILGREPISISTKDKIKH